MANDRDKKDSMKDLDQKSGEKSGHDRVIGRGMTSPDSTQVPLRAEDGEPDLDAIKGRIPPDNDDNDRASRR
jgi:hypothetical protein